MDDWHTDRIGAALRGENPTVLVRLPAGFVMFGDSQFLPGYCVLVTDDPGIDRLLDLPRPRRLAFLADMDRLGEAVVTVCARHDPAFRRINYMVLGNLDPYLHAHVHPRYTWEPEQYAHSPITAYPADLRNAPRDAIGPHHDTLRADLTAELNRLT